MSSLRRHFHFGLGKASAESAHLGTPMHSLPEGNVIPPVGCIINRDIFLNDFSNCVEMITNFVQSLNSLCNAGTVLGQSFLQVFKDIPSSYEVALQFQNVWEDASKATAGASADVKTETLFLLQEVLNKLDLEGDCLQECSPVVAECRQALGICLLAYTELQVYFSLFIWKSLNAVCRNLATSEFLSMYSGSAVAGNCGINGYFGLKSNTLSTNIRKHFTHLLQKCENSNRSDSSESLRAGFYPTTDCPSDREGSLGTTADANLGPTVSTPTNLPWSPESIFAQNVCNTGTEAASTWTPANTYPQGTMTPSVSTSPSRTVPCGASNQAVMAGSKPQVSALSRKGMSRNGVLDIPTELESVICLLSCKAAKGTEAGKSATSPISDKALLRRAVGQPWTDVQESCASLTTLGVSVTSASSAQFSDGTRTWPRVGTNNNLPNFRSDPCFWRGSPFGTQFGSSSGCTQGQSEGHANQKLPSSQEQAKDELLASWSALNQERWQNKQSGNASSDDENSNGQEVDYLSLGVNLLIGERQRRHSASSDWLSEICNVAEESKELELLWETRAGKTSTWPLKVSPRTPEPTLHDISPTDSALNLGMNQMWNINETLSETDAGNDVKGNKYSLFGQSTT